LTFRKYICLVLLFILIIFSCSVADFSVKINEFFDPNYKEEEKEKTPKLPNPSIFITDGSSDVMVYLTIELTASTAVQNVVYNWSVTGNGSIENTVDVVDYTAPSAIENAIVSCFLSKPGYLDSNDTTLNINVTTLDVSHDLELWLNIDRITTLNDGDPVSSWPDSSGNNNNATNAGSIRPTYETNELNGKPVISFDGVEDYLIFSAIDMQPATVFAVVQYRLPAVNAPFLGNEPSASGGRNEYFGYYGGTIYYYSNPGANMSIANALPDPSRLS